MPPGPAYNFLCIATSAFRILSNVAEIRVAQLARNSGVQGASCVLPEMRGSAGERKNVGKNSPQASELQGEPVRAERNRAQDCAVTNLPERPAHNVHIERTNISEQTSNIDPALSTTRDSLPPFPVLQPVNTGFEEPIAVAHVDPVVARSEPARTPTDLSAITSIPSTAPVVPLTELQQIPSAAEAALAPIRNTPTSVRILQSSKVPSSRIGRLFHYGGLAASMGYGAAAELLRRTASSPDDDHIQGSLMMSEGNIKRLVAKLTKMRGAALKLGQFMSIQDTHVLPPELEDIFRRVQDGAHYMPDWQMEQVMQVSLGPDWRTRFASFDRVPFAAASIGQVHSAVLDARFSPTGRDEPMAVKIQFPNIKESIESDLGYIKLLLTAGRILPKGLFLDRTLQVMGSELADECNYTREAFFLRLFRSHLENDARFHVPWVWEGSTNQVLVMERVDGVSVGGSVMEGLTQEDKNTIAERIIDLCLRELFLFRTMQTDPNWTNFLWNDRTHTIELVDFGATREYTKEFIDNWLRLLQTAASSDREACIKWSRKVGYLTGEEDEIMLNAHAKSMALLATPFKPETPQPFTFGPNSQWSQITTEIREQIPVMLQRRLTPPPRETYSLNRKLSGAFLLAARLNARVDCKRLWDGVVDGYQFDT